MLACSFYIINERSLNLIKEGKSVENIAHKLPHRVFWTNNPNIPEDLIAVEEKWLVEAYGKAGFKTESIMYGTWPASGNSSIYANPI